MKENEKSLDRVGDITGRRVDFTKGLPLAWGIEIELPFDSVEKSRLFNKYKIKIPDHIDTFKFLDLNPQESLPNEDRNICAPEERWVETNLYLLTATDSLSKRAALTRRRKIEDIFYFVFGWNEIEIGKFNKILRKSEGNTILCVEGHSWDAPWKIGEYDSGGPYDPEAKRLQKRGNGVPVWKILKKYNNPKEYATIMIFACYSGERKVGALEVPLVYGLGTVGAGWKSESGQLPTVIVPPRPRAIV